MEPANSTTAATDLPAEIWAQVAALMSVKEWARASGICRAASQAPLRSITLKQPPDAAAMRWIVRHWESCQTLALALDPLQLLEAAGIEVSVPGWGQLRELALCVAIEASRPGQSSLNRYLRALLRAPARLRLLCLEADSFDRVPLAASLHHLLLFVRRDLAAEACAAIEALCALETLRIACARTYDGRTQARYAMRLPLLDLRACGRLRAVSLAHAVPDALLLPPPRGSSSAWIEADPATLRGAWERGMRSLRGCSLYTDDRLALAGALAELLALRCETLTVLRITCAHLEAACDLPALRELHVKCLGAVDVCFRSPLRLTALSLDAISLRRFEFDSAEGLAGSLAWLHVRCCSCGPAPFLRPLLEACLRRGVQPFFQEKIMHCGRCSEIHADPDAGEAPDAAERDVLAYFPEAAAKAGRPCGCGACERCLRAAGAMHVDACAPSLPLLIAEDPPGDDDDEHEWW